LEGESPKDESSNPTGTIGSKEKIKVSNQESKRENLLGDE
tara:strand:- start:986 stop:1105 length:120 start_codon:yes stop_codon:yes gene_type:complete